MQINTQVNGIDEIKAMLKDLGKTKAKACIRKGSRAAAKIVQKEVIAKAPSLTGTLKRNIKVRSLARSRRWVGSKVIETSPHAGFTEFGTKYIKPGNAVKEAFESVKSQAEDEFIKVILEEIEKRQS